MVRSKVLDLTDHRSVGGRSLTEVSELEKFFDDSDVKVVEDDDCLVVEKKLGPIFEDVSKQRTEEPEKVAMSSEGTIFAPERIVGLYIQAKKAQNIVMLNRPPRL